MRPTFLNSLFADVTSLKGVGPRVKAQIQKVAGDKVVHLLWTLPTNIIDRRYKPDIATAEPGRIATIKVTVGQHVIPRNRRMPYRIRVHDDTGSMTLVFFNARASYLAEQFPEGETRIVSGEIERYGGEIQMTHPDYIVAPDAEESIPDVEPVYPLTAGLSQKVMRRAVEKAVAIAPQLDEWIRSDLKTQHNWPDWQTAIREAHKPQSHLDLERSTPDRMRLAYDEFLANQLALGLMRTRTRKRKGIQQGGTGKTRKRILEALTFQLTNAQKESLAEIDADMADRSAMLRLLQGDVGSGKTVVALLAMVNAIENGGQTAIMAPTEILARQHYAGMEPLAKAAGIRIALLTSRLKGKERIALLEKLAAGEIDLLVATHAAFQDKVQYKNLTAVVIDEQHRFGVYQRMALMQKAGTMPDVLVMTATPIPRTLTLTVYGDMDVSRLYEKPPGRKPIETSVISLERLQSVAEGLSRAIGRDERVYWVCPLIEESEALDLAAAEDRYQYLKSLYGDRVGLIHGKMKGEERDTVMSRFQSGEIKVLVATTVIEVGVDVPEATIMVIEHAERFGLAQLHQLRGRVGRGEYPSKCVLLRAPSIGDTARARLKIMRETEDGFRIAEEDLRLRGAGELLGTRQSGFPEFHLGDPVGQADLLAIAAKDARLVLEKDAGLSSEHGKALRTLLYLFERNTAVRFLEGG